MRKGTAALMTPLLALVVFSFSFAITINAQASCTGSSPTWSSTPDYASVSSCVSRASRNDTINVSAGSATWSSTLTLTVGVRLLGAGSGNTVITAGGTQDLIDINPDATAVANDEIIEVNGFTLDANNNQVFAIIHVIGGGADNGSKPFRNLIITNNVLKNTNSAQGGGNTGVYTNGGQVRGLISGNIFDRVDMPFRTFGADDTTEWSNTAYNQFSYGSSDNLYFENNTIQFSSTYTSTDGNGGWIESGQGGRLVVRFNTWNLTNLTNPTEFWDTHGFQNWNGSPGSGQTGTMIVEYYDNTIANVANTAYRWIDFRGSWGIFFDNTYSGLTSPDIEANQYSTGCTALISPAPSNYNPLINNTYVFNNSVNSTITGMTAGSSNDCNTSENSNWWNYNASFNGKVGVGRGVKSSMPSTCTIGVGYWVTNEGSWNTKLTPNTSGQFYQCTATNTWTLYYTPYTYPDPLGIAPPTNLTAVVQ